MRGLITTTSRYPWLPSTLAQFFSSLGHEVSIRETPLPIKYGAAFADHVENEKQCAFYEEIYPLRPPQYTEGRCPEVGFDFEIAIPVESVQLKIIGVDDAVQRRVARMLGLAGLAECRLHSAALAEGRRLYCPDKSKPTMQLISWLCAQAGYPVDLVSIAEQELRDAYGSRNVLAIDDTRDDGYWAHIPVSLVGDDDVILNGLRARLQDLGYRTVHVRRRPVAVAKDTAIRMDVGALDHIAAYDERDRLVDNVREALEEYGVDGRRYPVLVESEDVGLAPPTIEMSIPASAVMEGALPPYGTYSKDRVALCIKSDDHDMAAALAEELKKQEFYDVYIEPLSKEDTKHGFCVIAQKRTISLVIENGIEKAFQRFVDERFGPSVWDIKFRFDIEEGVISRLTGEAFSAPLIVDIIAPFSAANDGSLLALMKDCSQYNLTCRVLSYSHKAAYEPLVEALELMGFGSVQWDRYTDKDEECAIAYGAASEIVIEEIVQRVRETTGIEVAPRKAWHDRDPDIWLYLPEPQKEDTASTVNDESAFEETLAEGSRKYEYHHAGRPFVMCNSRSVKIGEVELPRRETADAHLVPPLSMFRHYVIDRGSAHILESLAESLLLGEPVLLEGGTGTSKTSSILYLAALLGQPVVRINLNGHTDTSELVGRFQPDDGAADLPGPEALQSYADCLTYRSRRLVERVIEQGRDFTADERQLLKAAEGWPSRPWRWRDGLVPMAMRRGWWVILDEVNLAEPQVIERLNSVLEMPSSLVLTEHDGSALEAAEGFHLFATMNPEKYAGRATLSPAFLDRWLCYLRVEGPDEVDLLATLRCWVLGETPRVVIRRVAWEAEQIAPIFTEVASMPEVETFLVALAAFHQGVLAGQDNGMDGSRRRLLAALRYLDRSLALGVAPQLAVERLFQRYYLRGNTEDLSLKQLAEATGLDHFLVDGDGV